MMDAVSPYLGRVFLYERDQDGQWELAQVLLSPAGQLSDRFGTALDLDGDTLIVGAYTSTPEGGPEWAGAVYLFQRQAIGEWLETGRFTGGQHHQYFGYRVALDGDSAVVAHAELDTVHFLQRDPGSGIWSETTVIEPGWPMSRAGYTMSVALSGDTAAVGLVESDASGSVTRDAVSIFQRDPADPGRWTPDQVLDGRPYWVAGALEFGRVMALDGDTLLVGNPEWGTEAQPRIGRVHLFRRWPGSAWLRAGAWLASSGARYNDFGSAVALSEGTAVVGAPQGLTDRMGFAYVFEEQGED
jgi:hypothetical protein